MSIKSVLPFIAAAALASLGATALAQTPPPPPPPMVAGYQPQPVLLLAPVSIARMQPDNVVAVKGIVSEVFGNKFILQDDTGRALVELGPRGEDGAAVVRGETVTVQGVFDRGFIHAQLIARPDGRNQAFGPMHPPRPPVEADRGPGRRLPPIPH